MLRRAGADKTLAAFVGGRGEALPGALREDVRELPFYPPAAALVPTCRERAAPGGRHRAELSAAGDG